MTATDITGRRPTRTPETEAAYAKRLRQLVVRVADTRDIAETAVSSSDLLSDLDARAGTLSAATLRQYRAAITFGLESGRIQKGQRAPQGATIPQGRRKGQATASLKSKRVSDADLRRIDEVLRCSRSRYAQELRAFLLANRIVGARLKEWRTARFVRAHAATGRPALILENAKASNQRAHGSKRTLHLGDLPAHAVTTIATCARWLSGRQSSGMFDRWQAGASKLLQRVCRRLWPRRRRQISLYSTRHHAAARYKAGFDKAQVAALLGHGALTTAGTHYARTARGRQRPRPASLPAPDSADIKRVWARAHATVRPKSLATWSAPSP